MKQIYTNISSLAKMLCVMICMSFVGLSAFANASFNVQGTTNQVTFTYTFDGTGPAFVRLVTPAEITKNKGKYDDCAAYAQKNITTLPSGSISFDTTNYPEGTYVALFYQDGKRVGMSGYEKKIVKPYISPVQKDNSVVINYALPASVSSPYIKVCKCYDLSKYGSPLTCPAYRTYQVQSGTTTMTQSVADWDNAEYVFFLFNNGTICADCNAITINPIKNKITNASVNYEEKKLYVSYILQSSGTIQIAGTSLSKNVAAGESTVSFDLSTLSNGSYTVEIKGATAANCSAKFNYYLSSLKASINNSTNTATINYAVGGATANATIKVFTYAAHYSKGDNATPVYTKTVSQRNGSLTVNTANWANGRYVVRLLAADRKLSAYIDVQVPLASINIENYPSSKYAYITYSPKESGYMANVMRTSGGTVMATSTSSPFTVHYGEWQGGDYDVTLYTASGKQADKKVLSIHKLTSIGKSGNTVVVGYEMGSFPVGSYTVMRFANVSTGRIYNEVPVNTNGNNPVGKVGIYASGPQFTSGIYVVYFVVDGKIYDSKKISLNF